MPGIDLQRCEAMDKGKGWQKEGGHGSNLTPCRPCLAFLAACCSRAHPSYLQLPGNGRNGRHPTTGSCDAPSAAQFQ